MPVDIVDGMVFLAQRKDGVPGSVLFGLGSWSWPNRRKERREQPFAPAADGHVQGRGLVSEARGDGGQRATFHDMSAQRFVKPVLRKIRVGEVAEGVRWDIS